MKKLQLVAVAVGLFAFTACNNEKAETETNSAEPVQSQPVQQAQPVEENKTTIDFDGESGEVGFENDDIDVNIDVDGDNK